MLRRLHLLPLLCGLVAAVSHTFLERQSQYAIELHSSHEVLLCSNLRLHERIGASDSAHTFVRQSKDPAKTTEAKMAFVSRD
jgi:hypothetical protein